MRRVHVQIVQPAGTILRLRDGSELRHGPMKMGNGSRACRPTNAGGGARRDDGMAMTRAYSPAPDGPRALTANRGHITCVGVALGVLSRLWTRPLALAAPDPPGPPGRRLFDIPFIRRRPGCVTFRRPSIAKSSLHYVPFLGRQHIYLLLLLALFAHAVTHTAAHMRL